MCKTDRESYEKYWDDISPFIKYGCIKDAKFAEKMGDYVLFKNLDGKYLTLKDCIEENKKETEETEAQTEEKKAVTSGYWNLFRFNPALAAEGKNPFHLDSKAPTTEYEDFIMGEVRYNALSRQNPERAKELFAEAKANAEAKYNRLKEMSDKQELPIVQMILI